LIEGNVTRPRDIERALAEELDEDRRTRDLQREAAAHVRVQRDIDERHAQGELGEPASIEFIRGIHRAFYDGAPEALLRIQRKHATDYSMVPREFFREPHQDNVVGRHLPLQGDDGRG
jgi:Fic family protein